MSSHPLLSAMRAPYFIHHIMANSAEQCWRATTTGPTWPCHPGTRFPPTLCTSKRPEQHIQKGTGVHRSSLLCLMCPGSEFSLQTESPLLLTTSVKRGSRHYVGIRLLAFRSDSCPAELTESDVGFFWYHMWNHTSLQICSSICGKNGASASAIPSMSGKTVCKSEKRFLCVAMASARGQHGPEQQLSRREVTHWQRSLPWSTSLCFVSIFLLISPSQNWAEFSAFARICQWHRGGSTLG